MFSGFFQKLLFTKELIKLGVPCSVNLFINLLSQFIIGYFVAQVNVESVSAYALFICCYTLISSTSSSILTIVMIKISKISSFQNARKHSRIYYHISLYLTLILSFFTSILFLISPLFLRLFRQDEHLIQLISPYLKFQAIMTFPFLFACLSQQFLLGFKKVNIILVLSIIRHLLTVSAVYELTIKSSHESHSSFFVNVGWIQLSTTLLYFIGLTIISTRLIDQSKKLFQLRKQYFTASFQLLKQGFFIGFQFFMELLSFSLSLFFIGWFGSKALASLQLVTQYSMLAVCINMGLSQATTILAIPLKKHSPQLANLFIQSLILNSGIILIFTCLSIYYYKNLTYFYIHSSEVDAEILNYCKLFFTLNALLILIDSWRCTLTAILRGCLDIYVPALLTVASIFGVGLTMSYLLGFTLHLNVLGLRLGIVFGFLATVILLMRRLFPFIRLSHVDT